MPVTQPFDSPEAWLMIVLIFLVLLASLPATSLFAQLGPVDHAHPLVGTANEGQTYPATGVPFAMTHWTPQTRAGEIKCVAPYYFADSTIQGFRGSHFLSGSCVPDYGSVTLMPSVGVLKTSAVDRASRFRRDGEHATPYSYKVNLTDPQGECGDHRCGQPGVLAQPAYPVIKVPDQSSHLYLIQQW
jgi:putative alpha-1,2-mannosidase